MTLIKSISGIRGTIGGKPGNGLTPVDIVNFAAAYGTFIQRQKGNQKIKIVLGRDARISGEFVESMVANTLMAMGAELVLLGFATTPTVEIAVPMEEADGGIILTASHNPGQWNALKLLNSKGEFLSAADGESLIKIIEEGDFRFAEIEKFGSMIKNDSYNKKHIDLILDLDLVNKDLIKKANFRVAIDCVNSVGGIILPELLKELGVSEVIELFTEPSGIFPHNPEPLPDNLKEISQKVIESKADVGFVVDPDVDRLAIINEDGSFFGEEYTLVAISDYILSKTPGNTCSNLSSTRALRDISIQHGVEYFSAAVGEVNVVEMMKKKNCIIGGEGNGGVIYPTLHYGRDALVGIALFLTQLAESKQKCSELRSLYPDYVISKNKISLDEGMDIEKLLSKIKEHYSDYKTNDVDGLKIEFEDSWVHLRKSNTEAIIRIYAEHRSAEEAENLAGNVLQTIKEYL
ncbi:MAG: phosphoglucosamine mutase [Bacteroidales bacterium]|nr:phosphoglucosamine mutase [Bacteroidales bacterium]MCF8389965.1 phosphoglucosamine mutase [Bacteroidales bacterium]